MPTDPKTFHPSSGTKNEQVIARVQVNPSSSSSSAARCTFSIQCKPFAVTFTMVFLNLCHNRGYHLQPILSIHVCFSIDPPVFFVSSHRTSLSAAKAMELRTAPTACAPRVLAPGVRGGAPRGARQRQQGLREQGLRERNI